MTRPFGKDRKKWDGLDTTTSIPSAVLSLTNGIRRCGSGTSLDGFTPQMTPNFLNKVRVKNTTTENPDKFAVWEDFAELDLYKFFSEKEIDGENISREKVFEVVKMFITDKGANLTKTILENTDFEVVYGPSPKIVIKRLLCSGNIGEERFDDLNKIKVFALRKLTDSELNIPADRITIEII
jgi:hypothetical protein